MLRHVGLPFGVTGLLYLLSCFLVILLVVCYFCSDVCLLIAGSRVCLLPLVVRFSCFVLFLLACITYCAHYGLVCMLVVGYWLVVLVLYGWCVWLFVLLFCLGLIACLVC